MSVVPIVRTRERFAVDTTAPFSVAKTYMEYAHVDGPSYSLWYHRGAFFIWRGAHYVELPTDDLRGRLYNFLHDCCVDASGQPIKARKAVVDNLLDALKAAAMLPDTYSAPCWITDTAPAPASELIAVGNGLLEIGSRKLHPHHAAFFTTFGLPFDFDDDAPTQPPNWITFLESIWPDDEESIRCLRQVCGYYLTQDHRHQKIVMLVGPKRSGKGTIAAIIKELVGPANFVSPTLSAFGAPFGLEPLIHASVACISDARISARTDLGQATENLLKISAGDTSTVPRKFRQDWSGVLPARLLILSNDLPRIADPSGALASRFVVLRMTKSFFGREDKGLLSRLKDELPAILNWALVGLDDLNSEGWLTEPLSSRESVNELYDLASPVGAFVREECVLEPNAYVSTDLLFTAWQEWCGANHREEKLVGDMAGFGSRLRSAAPTVVRRRLRIEGNRGYFYVGIRRKSAVEAESEAD